jgi:hypothetical protein
MLLDKSLTIPAETITFVPDRFRAPYAAVVGIDNENALQQGVIDWLRNINNQ